MRTRLAPALSGLFAALLGTACGGGGGGGGGAALKKAFVIPHVLESSGRCVQVATGDLNGDGVLDLVTLRESPSSVVVKLAIRESPTLASTGKTARGAAGYQPDSAHTLVWDSAADLALCDLDGDGRLDLVVAGGAAHQVGVWRCDPEFRDEFLVPFIVDATGPADRVATGDVNGDGRPDLVTLDESTGAVEVFLQTSASPLSFSPAPSKPAPLGACHGLVLADMDRDGRLDVVTNDPAGDRILFLFSEPIGFAATFRESPTKASTGRAMAVADVDGDGWLDVAVVDEGGTSVTCLLGSPATPRTFGDVHSPMGIAIKEQGVRFAGIAIGDPGVNGNYAQFADGGSPSGTFGSVRVRESPTRHTLSSAGLGLMDLDGDGRLDVVSLPEVDDDSIVLAFGSTSTRGGFDPAERAKGIITNTGTGGGPPKGMCVADFDGDGRLDVAVTSGDGEQITLGYGEIPANTARGPRQTTSLDGTFSHRDLAVADLDRDGLRDLVCATPNGVEVRFQDSPGNYSGPMTLLQGQDCRCVAVGDVNGDGLPDIVAGAGQSGATLIRNPAVIRGFLPPIPFGPPTGGTSVLRSLALVDLNRDGRLDLVCIRESPTLPKLHRCQGAGNGFFDIFVEVDCGAAGWIHVAAGDVNGDGRADLVVCGEQPDGCAVVLQEPVNPALPILFDPPAPIPLMGGVRVAVGDVDGDGRADIVTTGNGGAQVALQSHDVVGRFLASYSLFKEPCGGLALSDVDRDGMLDVCLVDTATGALLAITGDPDFDLLRVLSLNGLPPGEPVIGTLVVAGDVDGDGVDDLCVSARTAPGGAACTIHVFAPR